MPWTQETRIAECRRLSWRLMGIGEVPLKKSTARDNVRPRLCFKWTVTFPNLW